MDALLGHPLTEDSQELNQEIDKLETQKKELIYLIQKDREKHSTTKK